MGLIARLKAAYKAGFESATIEDPNEVQPADLYTLSLEDILLRLGMEDGYLPPRDSEDDDDNFFIQEELLDD